jgi:hypothetical protein
MATPRACGEDAALALTRSVASKSSKGSGDSGKSFAFQANAVPERKNACSLGRAISVEVNTIQATIKTDTTNFHIYQYNIKCIRRVDLGKAVDPKSEVRARLNKNSGIIQISRSFWAKGPSMMGIA